MSLSIFTELENKRMCLGFPEPLWLSSNDRMRPWDFESGSKCESLRCIAILMMSAPQEAELTFPSPLKKILYRNSQTPYKAIGKPLCSKLGVCDLALVICKEPLVKFSKNPSDYSILPVKLCSPQRVQFLCFWNHHQ